QPYVRSDSKLDDYDMFPEAHEQKCGYTDEIVDILSDLNSSAKSTPPLSSSSSPNSDSKWERESPLNTSMFDIGHDNDEVFGIPYDDGSSGADEVRNGRYGILTDFSKIRQKSSRTSTPI